MALFEIQPTEIVGHQARLFVNTAMLAACTVVDNKRTNTFIVSFHLHNADKPSISVDIVGDKIEGVLARLRSHWG